PVQHRADPGHGLHKPSLRRLLGSPDAPSARKSKSSRDPNSDREPNPRSLVRPLRQQAPQREQVVEIGRTAMDPMHEMMSVAHRGRPFAARPPAVSIARL